MGIACTVRMRRKRATWVQPGKLLLDPYAKAIAGSIRWSDALFGYTIGHPEADLSRDTRNSAADLPEVHRRRPGLQLGGRHASAPPGTRC